MLSQVSRASTRHAALRVSRRTMSTVLEESSSSRTGRSGGQFGAHREESKDMTQIYIRPAEGVRSTQEALAILRGLERRYGRFKWYRMFRDSEVHDLYQPYMFAELESEEALEAIPLGRQTVPLEIPIFERAQSGGICLQDLSKLLRPEDKVEGDPIPVFTPKAKDTPTTETSAAATPAASEAEVAPHESEEGEEAPPTPAPAPTSTVINVYIERSAKRRDHTTASFTLSRLRRMEVQRSFAQWGGFYQPPPPPSEEDDHVFGAPPPRPRPAVKRKHMDEILEKWAPTFESERQEREAVARAEAEAAERAAAVRAEAEAVKAEERAAAAAVVAAEEAAAAAELEAAAEAEAEQVLQRAKPAQPRISKKRERILELARQNAFAAQGQMPSAAPNAQAATGTPESDRQEKAEVVAEQKPEGEQAEAEKPTETMRDRLWKMMGGKWM